MKMNNMKRGDIIICIDNKIIAKNYFEHFIEYLICGEEYIINDILDSDLILDSVYIKVSSKCGIHKHYLSLVSNSDRFISLQEYRERCLTKLIEE